MIQTAIWVSPSLCGCQLKMTAFFSKGTIDGFVYQHPTVSLTGEVPEHQPIKDLEIVSVCDNHKSINMPDTNHLFNVPDADSVEGKLATKYGTSLVPIQRRGYLKHPIENPTDAEVLYTFLSQYGGKLHGLPCKCQAYIWIDEKGAETYIDHPLYTIKCQFHKSDTVDMQQAITDDIEITQKI